MPLHSAQRPAAPPAKGAPTVLVVDDARSVRELLNLRLSHAGYRVLLAEDAVVAAARVLERVPDIIILDVQMPYMNGYEFLTALRADAATREIPVVLLTSTTDVAVHARELGAVAYLSKPVAAERLLEIVALYIPDRIA
jgi:chemosensory pili system protein ChpA (sensor histidine kinase/response regulator)